MLTDAQCRNATCPPDKKRLRLADAQSLCLEISAGGSKRWFWKTYANGKEGRIALGSYPAVSLTTARKARDAAKLEFPPFHGRLSAEEFSAGMVAFATGDCSDFA